MRSAAMLALALLACEPNICREPCMGQSASEERGAGIVCQCGPNFAMMFAWTLDDAVCEADRIEWAKRAPLPCAQPGGGAKRQNP